MSHNSQGQEDQSVLIVPLHMFTVENWGSLREPPSLDASLKLLWQYCADGFVSSDEPVTIRMKDCKAN